MKILVTGSSGQIGTNLALRLQARRARGVRRRQAPEHVDGRVSLSPAGPRRPLRRVPRGDQRRRVPGGRPRRPPRRAREGAPARPAAAPGARERGHDVQRARVRATTERADRVLVEPRGVRRRASFRGVRRAGRRLRLRGEHVLGVEDLRRGVRLLLRALLRASVSRIPLLERLRAVRQRPPPDGSRDPALHPFDAARRADHDLRRKRQDARLHVRRRLHRRHRGGDRGTRRSGAS